MIRELQSVSKSDLSRINVLRKDVSEQDPSVINKDSYELNELKGEYILISENQELEGYLTLGRESDVSPSNEIHLNVFVSPKHQNSGLGTDFIRRAKEKAVIMHGINKITIMVEKKKPELKPFYEKRGFNLLKENSYCWYMAYEISQFT